MSLAGRTAIVTGAASGIGRATAERIAAEGGSVVCADVADAGPTAAAIGEAGGAAVAVALDVRDGGQWAAADALARETYGQVDCLVNIAGVVTEVDTVHEQTEEEWDRLLDVNLRGTWLGMKTVLPAMVARESGRIVNTASVAAIMGMAGLAAYSASKGGVAALTRQASIEYVRQGITVNAISPGYTRTPIQDGMDPELLKAQAAELPIGYMAKPKDLAGLFAYLISDEAFYVTGQVIAVDGGWTTA